MSKPTSIQRRSASRFYAVQALFQMEATDLDLAQVQKEFEETRIGAVIDDEQYADANIGFFETLTTQAVTNQITIDKLTDTALVDRWPLGRIDPTLRAIFRVGVGEILLGKTPRKVIITEYIDIAKAYFPDQKEPKLVNAVLDHISKEILEK